jgi:hypothetical protein
MFLGRENSLKKGMMEAKQSLYLSMGEEDNPFTGIYKETWRNILISQGDKQSRKPETFF